MSLPTPYTLAVKRRQTGSRDSHGKPSVTYAAGVAWPVHGYAPGADATRSDANRDLSLILWTVYAPADNLAPGELDLVTLGGVDYMVEGRPDDWTKGPWLHPTAGLVVELKRAEG
ncbi:MAG TPA: hypothetical protein VGM94_09505 [Galbitalea sp.]